MATKTINSSSQTNAGGGMNKLFSVLGVDRLTVTHAERIASALGGFSAIFCIMTISRWYLDPLAAGVIIASMGASAVLLFAVPHGQLSQPWPVLGGHVLSAIIGVSCAQWISNEVLAASLAVGLAIGVMYYSRSIHPPGGATALAAVVGGQSTHALGYQFVVTPVLVNVLIILSVAVGFNYLFKWRRYPLYLHRKSLQKTSDPQHTSVPSISHEDFVYALSQMDSFVDISEDELIRLYDIATKKSREHLFDPDQLVVGGYYSNGQYGSDWSVRYIVDESVSPDPDKDLLIYKIVAGVGRRQSGYTTRTEFSRWARHQVIRDEDNWKRAD